MPDGTWRGAITVPQLDGSPRRIWRRGKTKAVVTRKLKAAREEAEAGILHRDTTVTFGGTALTDNAQIPGSLRGYVQIAINKGLFEAFPAEVRQIAPGQFIAVPGPRFEPASAVTRATLAEKLLLYRQVFNIGG